MRMRVRMTGQVNLLIVDIFDGDLQDAVSRSGIGRVLVLGEYRHGVFAEA